MVQPTMCFFCRPTAQRTEKKHTAAAPARCGQLKLDEKQIPLQEMNN